MSDEPVYTVTAESDDCKIEFTSTDVDILQYRIGYGGKKIYSDDPEYFEYAYNWKTKFNERVIPAKSHDGVELRFDALANDKGIQYTITDKKKAMEAEAEKISVKRQARVVVPRNITMEDLTNAAKAAGAPPSAKVYTITLTQGTEVTFNWSELV